MCERVSLDAESRHRLNGILDGCFWNACFIDRQTALAALAVELVGVLFDEQQIGDAFPVTLVCHPVSRVAVSYQVDGRVKSVDIEDLNSVLQEFTSREIDDWDIVDPSVSGRFARRNNLSLNISMGATGGMHVVQMWQDEAPFQTLDLAVWFQDLILLDTRLKSLSLKDLESARARAKRIAPPYYTRRCIVPLLDADVLLDKITRK